MADWRLVKDKAFTALVVLVSVAFTAPIVHLVLSIGARGAEAIAKGGLGVITGTPGPPGSSQLGGIAPAVIGTLTLGALTSAIGLPLAFLTAVMLVEFRGSRLARAARALAMSLLEVPTVLIGMMVYVVLVVPLKGFSLLAGSLALSIVMLPYVTVYVERALDNVPKTYREAGLAIGMDRASVVFRVVVGVARRGVLAGFLIGFAKAVGETAPLLFTIGAAREAAPLSPLAPGDAIPLMIFHFIATPYENWRELAWAGALLLMLMILLVFAVSRALVREVRA